MEANHKAKIADAFSQVSSSNFLGAVGSKSLPLHYFCFKQNDSLLLLMKSLSICMKIVEGKSKSPSSHPPPPHTQAFKTIL